MNILNSYRHIRPIKGENPTPEIPDDSEEKIGYGLGIAKNYRVGSGIGYPSGTADKLVLQNQTHRQPPVHP